MTETKCGAELPSWAAQTRVHTQMSLPLAVKHPHHVADTNIGNSLLEHETLLRPAVHLSDSLRMWEKFHLLFIFLHGTGSMVLCVLTCRYGRGLLIQISWEHKTSSDQMHFELTKVHSFMNVPLLTISIAFEILSVSASSGELNWALKSKSGTTIGLC